MPSLRKDKQKDRQTKIERKKIQTDWKKYGWLVGWLVQCYG